VLTVHHLEDSRSQRILWLLEELEVDYEIRRYARDPKTMLAPPQMRAIHPLGKSPIVTDEHGVFAESGAIIEHLAETYGAGRLMPPDGTPEKDRCRYWLHYAEGSLMPLLLLKLVFSKIHEPPVPFFLRPVTKAIADQVDRAFTGPQLELHLGFVEGELAKSTWFVGDELTAADIQMSFPLETGADRGAASGDHPRIRRFVERVHARPAYRRALERGGPYAYGPRGAA